MFWKSKTEKEIETKARASERAICEEHYLSELSRQRKRFSGRFNDREIEFQKESEKKIRDVENRLGVEISRLNNRISFLEDENKRFLKAVSLVAPYAYKLESIASSLAVESQDIALEKARKLANINNSKHELEMTLRKIEKLSPKISKLMQHESVLNEEVIQ